MAVSKEVEPRKYLQVRKDLSSLLFSDFRSLNEPGKVCGFALVSVRIRIQLFISMRGPDQGIQTNPVPWSEVTKG
jgi:hypothetical protein